MKRPTDDRTLSPEQFTAALAALGWKQSDFARRCGLSVQAVSNWATGTVPPPIWAAEYLGAMQDLQALHAKYLSPLRPGRLAPGEPDEEQPPSPGAD